MLNWRRRSTVGLAVDFPVVNVLGFVCYAVSTCCFLYSDLIRYQYAARNPLAPLPTVRFNDLAFALHAVLLTSVTYSQFYCWGLKRDRSQRVTRPILGICAGSVLGVVCVAALVNARGLDGGNDPSGWAWIDVVSASPPDPALQTALSGPKSDRRGPSRSTQSATSSF